MQHANRFSKTTLPLASLFLGVFYLSEAWNKCSHFFLDENSNVQRAVKLVVMVFLTVALLKKSIRLFLFPVLLALSFLLGQIFLENGFQADVVVNFGKYLFPIFLFMFFTKYPRQVFKNLLFKVFEAVILFNSLLILLGFIFGIDLFATYDGRFGYNGLFVASATGSYIYVISLFCLLFRLKEKFLANWKVLFVLVACLLMGTKTIYLGAFAVILGWLWWYAGLSKTQKGILIAVVFAIFCAAFYYFFFEAGIFNEIRQERGLTDALFSFRNDLFFNQTWPFIENNWKWGNYLFGGIENLISKSQMEIIDLFYFWGIFGGILYLLGFYKTYVTFPITKPVGYGFVVILGLACLAGHFFVNASLMIYLLVLRGQLSLLENRHKESMPSERIQLLNANIDNLSMEETLQRVSTAIQEKKHLHHSVVNAGKIVAMQKDAALRKSVNEADLINADGQAVVWASKFLGKPLKERVAGIDLFSNLLEMAKRQKHSVYLLGAKEEVLQKLVGIIEKKYGSGIVAGYHHGYFSKEEETQIVEGIAESGANMLFVAMTSPKKEMFLHMHKKALQNLNFIMGVGGSFDVLSGKTKRAPVWMQKIGMEWLYRVYQEPGRMWKRYLIGNTKFVWLVLKGKFRT